MLMGLLVLVTVFAYSQKKYEIGDTGPGGGIIYLVNDEEGYTYECSDILGETTWTQAKEDIKKYQGGGLSDWYLPDYIAAGWVYKNLKGSGLGKFGENTYWVNSERYANSGQAYVINFKDGDASKRHNKTNKFRYFAVRAFKM